MDLGSIHTMVSLWEIILMLRVFGIKSNIGVIVVWDYWDRNLLICGIFFAVAKHVGFSAGKCRQRWLSYANPNIKKGRWTAAEDKVGIMSPAAIHTCCMCLYHLCLAFERGTC